MSIRVNPDQKFIVYPPALGDGVCAELCAHYECMVARKDAAKICPECNQPIGFGAVQPFFQNTWSEIRDIHYDCYQTRLAREEAEKAIPTPTAPG